MVAVKGKLNSLTNRVTQDQKNSNIGGVRNFKIYAEVDNVKVGERDPLTNQFKGKSVPSNQGSSLLNAKDAKSGVKNLEKGKSKIDTSVKVTVRRKVLADISNAKGSFSKTELQGCSRREDRVSAGRRKASCLSDKSSGAQSIRVSKQGNMTQSSTENHRKRQVQKNAKTISEKLGTRVQGRVSMVTIDRTTVRNPLPPTSGLRKSLQVLKQNKKLETSDTKKENSDESERVTVKHGFPVKPRVSRTGVPLPSNSASRPWRNRVSGGFAVTASRDQSKVGARELSRKSVKNTVKITSAASNTHRNSKSKCTVGMNKLRSGAAITLKRNRDRSRSSLSAETSSVLSSEQPAQGEADSGSNSNFDGTRLDVIARRKSDRRNSFTFSLMSGSKLAKEHPKTQDILTNIYDGRNHLEVSNYVDDIYEYYWVMEDCSPVLKDYMDIQTSINPQIRGILINWLIEVHHKFDLMPETLFLMVTLLDRYLSLEIIKKNEMQLVGLTALLLASKYEDFWAPKVVDLISIAAESYTRDLMLAMEMAILKKLKFRLNGPTPYVFMLRFLRAAQSDAKFEHLAFYLLELCLVEYGALNYKPSLLCASAVYLARCTMKMTPAWTPLLEKHARYEESHLRECAGMILKFHKAAKTSVLKVSYEKYMKPNYHRVAAIKPLDVLPRRSDF